MTLQQLTKWEMQILAAFRNAVIPNDVPDSFLIDLALFLETPYVLCQSEEIERHSEPWIS